MGKTVKRVYDYEKPDGERRRTLDELIYNEELAALYEEDHMDNVFIIQQVWTPVDSPYELSEIHGDSGATFYPTWADAVDELRRIAADHDIELDESDSTFNVPTPEKGVDEEYYYIEALWRQA